MGGIVPEGRKTVTARRGLPRQAPRRPVPLRKAAIHGGLPVHSFRKIPFGPESVTTTDSR